MAEISSCQICGISESKYSCPQCQISYCSVPCYQSESHLQCSENFYEQWVHEDLRNCPSDPEVKKRMMKILTQIQEADSDISLDSDDDAAVEDLRTRIKNVDLDDEDALWEKLTRNEQQEFKKFVATGHIVKILPDWEPWWKTKRRKTLIQDCNEIFDCKIVCPNVPLDIPSLAKLTKIKPSPNVAFMLLNVLVSYVFTVRWFKGAHKEMPVEAISMCIALSATLRSNSIFTSSVEAFLAFENDFYQCEWLRGDTNNKFPIHEDLAEIIKGSEPEDLFFCIKAAICDLNSLCLEAFFILKENNANHLKWFSGTPPRLGLLQQISKKMTYYLSWVLDYGNVLLKIF